MTFLQRHLVCGLARGAFKRPCCGWQDPVDQDVNPGNLVDFAKPSMVNRFVVVDVGPDGLRSCVKILPLVREGQAIRSSI